jgi:hypothetical protein
VVCIPDVFSPAECAALRGRIDRLFEVQFPDGVHAEDLVQQPVERSPVGAYTVSKCYLVWSENRTSWVSTSLFPPRSNYCPNLVSGQRRSTGCSPGCSPTRPSTT